MNVAVIDVEAVLAGELVTPADGEAYYEVLRNEQQQPGPNRPEC